jgi:amino acid permease
MEYGMQGHSIPYSIFRIPISDLPCPRAILISVIDRGAVRWRATLLLIGTIIGAGIFGVPVMIGAWGVVPSTIAFAILTGVVLCAHLLYAEAIIANKKPSRAAGQAKRWLGRGWASVTGALQTIQIFGSSLAYVILGGEFLAVLARLLGFDVPVLFWQVGFWLAGGFLVLRGLKLTARVESYLTWLLVAVIALLIGVFSSQMDFRILFDVSVRWTFEPYGVILFALLGITIVPEVAAVAGYRRDDVFRSVIRGTLLASALTYGFGVTAWLASSGALGRDPADLVSTLPAALASVIPVFGFLAVMTSFAASSLDLRSMFRVDYGLANAASWAAALGVPLVLLFLTPRDFLATIGLVGSVFGAAIAILVSFMGRAALRRGPKIEKWCTLWWWREAAPAAVAVFLTVGGLAWLFSGPFGI